MNFEVNVDVWKEILRFSEKKDNKCASFIRVKFPSIIIIW